MACLSNNVVIAEILIAKGADLNALNTVSKPCVYINHANIIKNFPYRRKFIVYKIPNNV